MAIFRSAAATTASAVLFAGAALAQETPAAGNGQPASQVEDIVAQLTTPKAQAKPEHKPQPHPPTQPAHSKPAPGRHEPAHPAHTPAPNQAKNIIYGLAALLLGYWPTLIWPRSSNRVLCPTTYVT